MSLLEQLVPTPGDVFLERYQLTEELGRGGFGVVFRATHLGLDEDVAVKVLLPHVVVNKALCQRFEREVLVAKGLRHPNTIRILDNGVTPGGLPFFVMEFLDGPSLSSAIQAEGPLSPERARRIGYQMLGSLAEAHAKGVIHRDLKPSNLVLCDIVGAKDFVKVLDFGIAKAVVNPGDGMAETQSGVVLGTVHYMSPEQAHGRRDIDARSDLYSAGLVIAECLAGRPIVDGETPFQMLLAHTAADPLDFPRAVRRSPLWPIIERATAKKRDDRYPDASVMQAELEALSELSDVPLPEVADPGLGRRRRTPPPAKPSPLLEAETRRVESGPQEVVLSSDVDHEAATVPAPLQGDAADDEPMKKKALTWLLLAVAGVMAGVVALALSIGNGESNTAADRGPSPTAERRGAAEVAAVGATPLPAPAEASPETPDLAEPRGAPDARTESAGAEATSRGAGTHLAQGVLDRAASAATRVADAPRPEVFWAEAASAALARVAAAIPPVHRVRFRGTEGCEVLLDDAPLGVVPFEGPLPDVDRRVELRFQRSGYRSETRELALTEDEVVVELSRSRQREAPPPTEEPRDDSDRVTDSQETEPEPDQGSSAHEREREREREAEPEPESAQPSTPRTPFGHAPIDQAPP